MQVFVEPELTGHLHGFAIRFGGEEVAVYPSWNSACAGLRSATAAMALLDTLLKPPPPEAAA